MRKSPKSPKSPKSRKSPKSERLAAKRDFWIQRDLEREDSRETFGTKEILRERRSSRVDQIGLNIELNSERIQHSK